MASKMRLSFKLNQFFNNRFIGSNAMPHRMFKIRFREKRVKKTKYPFQKTHDSVQKSFRYTPKLDTILK